MWSVFCIFDTKHTNFISHNLSEKKCVCLKPEEFFNSDDLIKLNKYVSLLELDYADIDIVIDKTDKRIYVCDINNGPMFGGGLPQDWYQKYWEDYLQAINEMLTTRID